MKKAIFILTTLLIIGGCNKFPSDSELPKNWDVDVYLPIIEEGYSILDLLESDEGYFIDSLGKTGVFSIVVDTFAHKTCAGELIENVAKVEDYQLTLPPASGSMLVMLPFSDPDVRLDTSFFVYGELRFNVSNNTDGEIDFKIEFPGAKRMNGDIFKVEFSVAEGETHNEIYNLEKIAYSSREYSKQNNTIKSNVSVDYHGNQGTVTALFSLTNTRSDYAKGILKSEQEIGDVLAMSLDSNIRRYSENIIFLNPTFTLLCDYQSTHNENFDVLVYDNELSGLRANSNEKIELIHKSNGKPFLDSVLLKGKIYEEKAIAENTNVVDFVNFLPDSISLHSMVKVNPNKKYGIITNEDTLNISAILSLGDEIKIESLNHVDTLDMDISEDIRVLLDNALEVDFKFDFWNSMQLASVADINFLSLDFDSLFTKQITIEPSVNDDFRHTHSQITLVKDEIDMLSDSYYIRLSFIINTEGENGDMQLRTNDSLKVKSKFRVKYHLDTEE